MSGESGTERLAAGGLAAKRRFPGQIQLIEELLIRNEGFRDMCEELAEAEFALSAIDTVPAALRRERTMEWTGWIDRLTAEIEEEVRRANVIPMDRSRPFRRP